MPACSRRFNKTDDEFASKQEWDDYLEEREDISECYQRSEKIVLIFVRRGTHALPLPPSVFNLIEGTDVKEMEARIEEYRRTNAESIIRNEAKKVCGCVSISTKLPCMLPNHRPTPPRRPKRCGSARPRRRTPAWPAPSAKA